MISTLNVAIVSLSRISENCSLLSNPLSLLLLLLTGCAASVEKNCHQPFSSACGIPQVLSYPRPPAPAEKACVVLKRKNPTQQHKSFFAVEGQQ